MSNFNEIDRKKQITPRQKEVLYYLAQGLQNKQIAYKMGLSEATIKLHLARAYERLHVKNRVEAFATILKMDLFD